MQDAEEYYRRTLSAKNLPINPESKTPSVDKAIRLTGLITDRMRVWESPLNSCKSLRELFKQETDFFDDPDANKDFAKKTKSELDDLYFGEPYKPNWFRLTLEIDVELRAVFHNRNESILQNRDANYLIDSVVNLILPTYFSEYELFFRRWDGSKFVKKTFISFSSGDEGYEQEVDNNFIKHNFINALRSWAKKITDYVSMYAPEVYEKHREQVENYFRHGKPKKTKPPTPTDPTSTTQHEPNQPDQPESKEELSATQKPSSHVATSANQQSVKLQWNGTAKTLYDVFRQLKNHHLPNGEALLEESYDQIARFIQQSFTGFDSVATSTIRGELTKNDRPKKSFNRKDLDLTQLD